MEALEIIPEPADPGATSPIPPQWSVSSVDQQVELTYSPSRWSPILVLALAMISLFGYWAAVSLYEWVFGLEQVVVAGVVLFVLLLAGLGGGFYLLDGMLDAATHYDLSSHALTIREHSLFRTSKDQIERDSIAEVAQVVIPPRAAADLETWRTVITYRPPGEGRTTQFILAGYTEQESSWLAPLLAHWANVKLTRRRLRA